MNNKQKRIFVYLLPTSTAFYLLSQFLGQKSGYFLGFFFYGDMPKI